ncbi:hypothetical protein BVRB_1g014010 [Beta vulgaris subsp. vulgaris]|nr:hypothetical protein BVRB_1g014010 [Beta vulgaris subsp. vulgaris]
MLPVVLVSFLSSFVTVVNAPPQASVVSSSSWLLHQPSSRSYVTLLMMFCRVLMVVALSLFCLLPP